MERLIISIQVENCTAAHYQHMHKHSYCCIHMMIIILCNLKILFICNFCASAQHSMAGSNGFVLFIDVCMHLFVRASVCLSRDDVNTISCRVFDTSSPNLHQ